MGFRIYRTGDGSGVIRYEKISTAIGGIGGGKSLRTATKIVAASNSLDKSSADYVCDGVHDEEEINKAISDLSATGGTVLLLEGTYNIGSAGIRTVQTEGGGESTAYGIYITSNVRLIGQGRSTILVTDSSNFDFGNSPVGAVILSDNASGIEISHITINGNQPNLATPICGIFLASFTERTSDSAITNCNVYNTAVAMGGYMDRCIIAENICNNNVYDGIAGGGDSNTVYCNICSDSFYGINIGGTNNCIYGNICYNIPYAGIFIGGSSYMTSSDNLACNNICRKCGSVGIVVDMADYCVVSGNIVRHDNVGGYGIAVRGTGHLIINNDLYQAGTSADFYDLGTDTVYHNNRTTQGWIP